MGYFTASIKNVKDTQVGDTITTVRDPGGGAPARLPPRPEPWSTAASTPRTASKYPDLRDALEKLQLNDASLSFEPESSVALGFGFRCGFLGMLHMEIIQERLEREFDLDLVTTLPSVIYEVTKTDGTVVRVDNPHNYPDPRLPSPRRGSPLPRSPSSPPRTMWATSCPCARSAGACLRTCSIWTPTWWNIHYSHAPQRDHLRLLRRPEGPHQGATPPWTTSWWAIEPRDLVKVDLLLNGEQVDALSFIVHREKAYGRARRICEKLKENIPRQLFEVPVQAAIGGKIIARETVKAMRKDVLAKCYGGDITRKKKLLEKQKEGKKKMRTLGTVQLPTEAFMAVLKLDE